MPEENVKVAVRVRPFNKREKDRNAQCIIDMNGATTTISDSTNQEEPRKFTFDYSYWSHDGCKEEGNGYWGQDTSHGNGKKFADQKKVYDQLGQGVLDNAWEGYNSTLFAYGQTGSGKSWSMVGYGINKGIVPQYCETLFRLIDEKKAAGEKAEYEVTLSMLEIYNEAVRDLLDSKANKNGLKVRQHPKLGFYAEKLKTVAVSSYVEIEQRIEEGTTNRTVASTKMNATSSRAHTIVGITFVQKTMNAANQEVAKTAIVNLVDLAGSERAESTGATGDRLKEGAAINQSLSCLGNCIAALADQAGGKNTRVPYRDSVLTKLLKNALGGNSRTIMIAALSPADINYDETLSTLRYADRAKQIKTKTSVNEDPTEQLIRDLTEENEKLKAMLASGNIDPSMFDADGDMTDEEKKQLKDELEGEYQSAMQENEKKMEEMQKTFEQRLAEAQAGGAGPDMAAIREKAKTVPHLWNLNPDPQLSRNVFHFIEEAETIIGNGKHPETDLVVRGVSIQPKHCTIWMDDNKAFTIETYKGARTLRNGKAVTSETKHLKHNDRIFIGTSLCYVFSNPAEKDAAKVKDSDITYDFAMEEIASKAGGLDMSGQDKSRDELLLQDSLLKVMPLVEQANGDAQALGKRKMFEMVLAPPEAMGIPGSKSEVLVRMTDIDAGVQWIWTKEKFMDRQALMAEMEDKFQDGEEWEVPQEKDPFYESPDEDFLIGVCKVWLKPLSYKIELNEQLAVTDIKGGNAGLAQVDIYPCDPKGKIYTEKDDVTVESSSELLGKDYNIKVKVTNARGLQPNRFTNIYSKYKFYLDEKWNQSKPIPNTNNPDWNFEKDFAFPSVTQQFVDYLEEGAFFIQIWGKQKVEKKKPGLGKVKSILGSKAVIHADGNTGGKKFDGEKVKYFLELATLKKRQEKMEQKLAHLRKMIEVAEKHEKKRISTKIVHDVYHAPSNDVAEKCIALIPTEKDSDGSSSSSSSSSSDEEKKKKKKAGAAAGGQAIAVVAPTPKTDDSKTEKQKKRRGSDSSSSASSSDEEKKKKKAKETKPSKRVPSPKQKQKAPKSPKSARSVKSSGGKKSSTCLLL